MQRAGEPFRLPGACCIVLKIVGNIVMMKLESPLTVLKGIGEKTAQNFAKAGIMTLEDLIGYYPRA